MPSNPRHLPPCEYCGKPAKYEIDGIASFCGRHLSYGVDVAPNSRIVVNRLLDEDER